MAAADYDNYSSSISPPPNPTAIDPVTYADSSRHVTPPQSQVSNTPKMTTPHPTLSQGQAIASPSLGGKQQ